MKQSVGYYPGCSLESTARDYRESLEAVAELMDLELMEVPDWNCCGASAGHSLSHAASFNLAARNLAQAAGGPQPVVVPCALCFNRLKSAQASLDKDAGLLLPELAGKKAGMAGVEVVELNSFLTTPERIDRAAAARRTALTGLKAVAYYGCQGQRPPRVTGHPGHENPLGLDRLLTALGAEALDWPFKTDCCGASHAVARPDIVDRLVGRLVTEARVRGADCLVTGCQMCQANLEMHQAKGEPPLPVFYFTELMGLALGHPKTGAWLARHLIDPRPLLGAAGLV